MTTSKKPSRPRGIVLTLEERTEAQATFLDWFARSANVRLSAEKANVDRSTVYEWLKAYPDFKTAWEAAEADARDHLREEIHRRAVEGWLEPVYQKGEKVGTIRRYSDRMLELLARARLPEHKAQQLDITSGGQPLHYATILASPDLAELAARLAETAGIDAGRISADSEPNVLDSPAYLPTE